MDFCAVERTDGFLPIERYAVISDGRSAGLVGADGSIDWWCVPQLDAPPVFDRILDAGAGRFSITPTAPFTARRRYRPSSNVLETEFRTDDGLVRVTDSLNSGHAGRLPWSELARRVEGLEGHMELAVTVSLGTRFGASEARESVTPNDGAFSLGPLLMQLRTSEDAVREVDGGEGGTLLRLDATEGSRSIVALLATEAEPLMDADIDKIDVRIDRSDEQWRNWAEDLTYDGPHRERVVRSALALKLLLFSPTGAIAAAVTTSLPESPGGVKNYDYRLAWIRDVAYSVKALLRIGAAEEAQAGFAWLMEALHRNMPDRSVFYTLDGDLPAEMVEAPLPGHRGAQPVRVGNTARDQLQLGCHGDILETAELFCRRGNHLDDRTREILGRVADLCATEWRDRDAGIWELDDPQHYTMSKIGCWLALDRAAKLADAGLFPAERGRGWRHEAGLVLDWIDEHCWSEDRRTYTMYAGSDELDAALLLATRFGFPRADRLEATREAVQAELARGPLVYRYTGMDEVEGAFLACSFWLVEALAFGGHHDDAERTMEELLNCTDADLGLMAEMVDPHTGAFLGNLPQGLSHLAMIHAALALTGDER